MPFFFAHLDFVILNVPNIIFGSHLFKRTSFPYNFEQHKGFIFILKDLFFFLSVIIETHNHKLHGINIG